MFLRLALLVALLTTQGPPEPMPPAAVHGDGGFVARQLADKPVIDGREWVAVNVVSGDLSTVVRSKDGRFTLRFREAGSDTGDFQRYQLFVERGRRPAVRIDDGFTGWVYVTPDSRYIFTEPLYVLDVREWKQYPLFDVLGIRNYTSIDAISRDGRHLLVSRRDCALDCKDERREYYAVTFPR
jgi:hypothetical protein